MSNTDFAIMEVLLHKGPLPVNTIGKKVLLTSGSITTAVDRLVERLMVERIPLSDARDRRVRLVRLTRSGTKLIKEAFKQHQRHLRRAVSALTEEEQDTLLTLLKKVGKGADALDILP
ncbi:MAG: winged helix-turn-helix transcriptional regulator [Candidatus Melainabacteria bacterium]|nr:winged helix-turn-helix transcriptional regulator [Candidatus Melainabacteria bacterium]